MQDAMVARVKSNPKYHELVKKRTRFGIIMSVLTLLIYYAFIMTIAFEPQVLGTPISEGSVTTVGILVGLGVIVSAFALTGIYVYRANTEFDRINNELKREVL